MSRIIVSLSGEGRGHSARTLCLFELLREHEVLALVPSNLKEWMTAASVHLPHVSFAELPSLSFQYSPSGKLSYAKSWVSALPFIRDLSSNLSWLRGVVEDFAPDLAITDFEPLLPRGARQMHVPLLSLDHQHFLYALDPRELPGGIRRKVRFLRPSVRMFCPAADEYLVSSFYKYPQRKAADHMQQIGVLLREELGRIPSQAGEHLMVYARRDNAKSWIADFKRTNHPCIVYCKEAQPSEGNVVIKQVGTPEFLSDLASCKALVTTAGNQLIGEALTLGKPVLAIPEYGNFEQAINGFFLQKSGMGMTVASEDFSQSSLHEFIEQLDAIRVQVSSYSGSGNRVVMKTIQRMLGSESTVRASETTRKKNKVEA